MTEPTKRIPRLFSSLDSLSERSLDVGPYSRNGPPQKPHSHSENVPFSFCMSRNAFAFDIEAAIFARFLIMSGQAMSLSTSSSS